MNELRAFVANMYFLTAKAALLCAVLICCSGLSYGLLAVVTGSEFAGLNSAQLFTIGLLGPIAFFALSVGLVSLGNFMGDRDEAHSS